MRFDRVNENGRLICRSEWACFDWFGDEDTEKKNLDPVQLELEFPDGRCKHKFVDAEDRQGNLGMVCENCGQFSAVSFADPYHGLTYQEAYELLQKEYGLK